MTSWMITVGSWETRFIKGFECAVEKFQPNNVLLFFYKEYAAWSQSNRRKAAAFCKRHGVNVQEHELSFLDPVNCWQVLYNSITQLNFRDEKVLFDITTMPRETIWTCLDLLVSRGAIVHYIYNQPERYNSQWLSRDPGEPRLVYKLSGEPRLGLPTKLLVLTGYDVDRVRQMIRFYEPQQTLLGIQVGNQLSNQALNIDKNREAFGKERAVELFDVDAYASDNGFAAIKSRLDVNLGNSNVIMSSLGPKLSAIALYRLHKLYPQTSLAYAPSREYNRRYSVGIGASYEGWIEEYPPK